MFRVLGYLGGLILFLVLGLKGVTPKIYYLLSFAGSLILLGMVILFRVLASYYNAFWMVWYKRYQKWTSDTLMCLGRYTEMPEYNPSPSLKPEQMNQNMEKRNFNEILGWGLLNFIISMAITGVSPLLLVIVILTYSEAIYHQCHFQENEKIRISVHQAEIARNTARMPFMQTLSDCVPSDNTKIEPSRSATQSAKYPLMDSTIRIKAISVNSIYPNQLTVNYQPKQPDEEEVKERKHSENLSTNISRDIQTFEAKQSLMHSVAEKENETDSDREEREERQIQMVDRNKMKGANAKRKASTKMQQIFQEKEEERDGEKSEEHHLKQEWSFKQKRQIGPHNDLDNDEL